jgi:hypothetical protein
MLTIHSLDVRFDVEGDDDAVFGKMFAEHIGRWARRQEEERCRRKEVERDRSLGDQSGEQPW